jgi:hypothetical protein
MFGFFFAALLHFLGCPAPLLGPPLIWCRLGCRLNHWCHCSAVDPLRRSSVRGSSSTSRQGGESSGSPSQGGAKETKKPPKVQKDRKLHDKQSLPSGSLPSEPAAAAGPLGTVTAPRVLTAASGQRTLAVAEQISAVNPLVSILKPPGMRPGIPQFLGI